MMKRSVIVRISGVIFSAVLANSQTSSAVNADTLSYRDLVFKSVQPLLLSLATDKVTYKSGDPVVVTVSLTNTSATDGSVPPGPHFAQRWIHLLVRDSNGEIVPPSPPGPFHVYVDMGHPTYIAGRATYSFSDKLSAWRFELGPGRYTITAQWSYGIDDQAKAEVRGTPLLVSKPTVIAILT